MSRIGKQVIKIPEGVSVVTEELNVVFVGPKGKLEVLIPKNVVIKIEDGAIRVEAENNLQGLIRSLLANAIKGVTEGWSKTLELSGTGYRASVAGSQLQLAVGFSHQVAITAPEGIEFGVKENKIIVSGSDKGRVGQLAATIRRVRPADPYKIKGFKYQDEIIIKKPGKAAKAGGTAAK